MLGVPAEGRARSKRWNSVVSPPVHSEWCRFTASMPASASAAAGCSGPSLHAPQEGRVDELHVGRVAPATTGTAAEVVVAEPEPADAAAGPAAAPPRATADAAAGVLHVEGQLEVGAAGPRTAPRASGCARAGRPGRSVGDRRRRSPADHAVVVEHRHAVPGEPDVALEPRRAQPHAPARRPRACSPGRGPGRPGGRTRSGGAAATAAGWARRPILAATLKRSPRPGRTLDLAGQRRWVVATETEESAAMATIRASCTTAATSS